VKEFFSGGIFLTRFWLIGGPSKISWKWGEPHKPVLWGENFGKLGGLDINEYLKGIL